MLAFMLNSFKNKGLHSMKWLKRIILAILILIAPMLIFCLYFVFTMPFLLWNPFEPPEMAAAKYASRDVVGDLGGVPVNIPRHFANYVEYEGDPGWGEKRKGPRPQRTHQSKLTSFGYYTRFPDMAGESSTELIKDKRSYSIHTTPWIDVGITTGNIYPGDGFLDGFSASMINSSSRYDQYKQLPKTEHGLTVYAAEGIDPKTNKPYREDTYAKDIFLHHDKTSRVDTYISCSNRVGTSQLCRHLFILKPHMHAKISVQYRRTQLPHWQEIQQAVTQQILGFKAAPTN